MKISQLRYFTTLAELENASKASELLHISQSSLSKNILALETELGVQLFDRNGKHLVLNPIGESFLESSQKILQEYDKAVENMNAITTGSNSKIKIGTCGSINTLIPVMTEFKKIHPETEFIIDTEIEGDDRIDINEFDVLVYPDELKFERFIGYPLYKESYCLAVSNTHPLRKEAAINSRTLNGLDMVFIRRGKANEHAYNVCSALSINFSSTSFVTSRAFHHDSIKSGLGVGFVPDGYKQLYSSDKIRLIPIVDNNFTRKYKICFKRKKHLDALAQEFEDFIISQCNLK